MITLAPFQVAAVDWFLGLHPLRGAIVLPPGSGKTRIGLAILSQLPFKGPGLVVVPTLVAGDAWLDQAAGLELSGTIVRPRSVSELQAARNALAHGLDPGTQVWIISEQMAAATGIGSVLREMPWSIVIYDEAHRTARDSESLLVGAPAILFLTATPDGVDWPVREVPVYAPAPSDVGVPRIEITLIDVPPSATESSFLQAVTRWQGRDIDEARRFRRALVAQRCASGVLSGIEALESLLQRGSPDGEGVKEEPLGHEDRQEVAALLDLAYAIDLPDSRSTALIREVRALDAARVVLVASLVAQLTYLTTLMREAGMEAIVVTNSLDKLERLDALERSRKADALLIVGDSTLGGAAGGRRDVLVHGDLPSPTRVRGRLASLMDGSNRVTPAMTSVVVRWAWSVPSPMDLRNSSEETCDRE